MARYTNVYETKGVRLDATYRKFIDVSICRAPHTWADYYCTAYVRGGYALTNHSYLGYTWEEVKRMFKREIDSAIEKCIFAREGERR